MLSSHPVSLLLYHPSMSPYSNQVHQNIAPLHRHHSIDSLIPLLEHTHQLSSFSIIREKNEIINGKWIYAKIIES
uniref:Ovule protein n=1 Tax=Ascaris lumbricoides TaxID=6252 RepID=A0A0M3IXT3_ASCLU